jgi:uncharacterized protein (TIGR03083 family)
MAPFHKIHTMIDGKAVLAKEAGRVSELSRSCDLGQPIPHLGRWKMRDLVAHLGGVHRWATQIVNTRSMDGVSSKKSRLDGIELCDWFDQGVNLLIAAFEDNEPDDPCANFNPGSDKTVSWWLRRQMHETTVHRWDAEFPLKCTTPIALEVAADGIDEFLDVFIRTRGKQTLEAPLVLSTTQPAAAWTLTPAERPGRVDIAGGSSLEVTTELTGPPEQLLLMLWGRLKLRDTDLTIVGDPKVPASLVAQ